MVIQKYPVSLTKLSRASGLSVPHISKILNGRGARETTLDKLARALGTTVSDLRRAYPRKRAA